MLPTASRTVSLSVFIFHRRVVVFFCRVFILLDSVVLFFLPYPNFIVHIDILENERAMSRTAKLKGRGSTVPARQHKQKQKQPCNRGVRCRVSKEVFGA